ncbi:MAG TPA: PP2C family protein-serine/threonine phosphatase [Spirochaetota bacterium]|nr:PP2C family protein-serine/threonine phosphatase [Spirochaetota bacterium]HPG50462.1 PP2C family protein-serine/threonine phosphatase [Spirochaetota bacterium]HPN12022.1 PP2C family protein-serine/threonine phosphatase [Spirochaetota bacterium]HQL81001.1 PP2C family protein-serine/threonine phosphatase [Spirochaetota bacterium]
MPGGAGHFPQILFRRRDNSFHKLHTKGTVMGWNSQIEISEETVDLESGDRLVLYTDGVTECKNRSGEMFTEERLKSLIAKNVALTAQGLSIQIIRNLVELITPGPFQDDLTLITIDINRRGVVKIYAPLTCFSLPAP